MLVVGMQTKEKTKLKKDSNKIMEFANYNYIKVFLTSYKK